MWRDKGDREKERREGEREKERRERFWKSSRKGLGENSRTNAPTWNTHQILDIFFLREAKIKHSRAYCLLISMCLLSLPKLKLPTNTFPTQCSGSVQINMGSSETMTPHKNCVLVH